MGLTFPAPADIAGDQLKAEIEKAGYKDVRVLYRPAMEAVEADPATDRPAQKAIPAEIEVNGTTASGSPIGEASSNKILGVVKSHRPAPAVKPRRTALAERIRGGQATAAERDEALAMLLDPSVQP